MKTKCAKTLAVLTASLLSLSGAGQAAAKDKESKSKDEPAPKEESTPKKASRSRDIKIGNRSQFSQIDLRRKVASMHVNEGQNLVHSGDGVKLMAEARNNRIVGWSATDDKGKKLSTKVETDGAGNVKEIIVQSSARPQTLVFKIGRIYISNSTSTPAPTPSPPRPR